MRPQWIATKPIRHEVISWPFEIQCLVTPSAALLSTCCLLHCIPLVKSFKMRPEWIATKTYEARSHSMTIPTSKSRNSECSIAINMLFAALYSSCQELQNETSVDSDKNL